MPRGSLIQERASLLMPSWGRLGRVLGWLTRAPIPALSCPSCSPSRTSRLVQWPGQLLCGPTFTIRESLWGVFWDPMSPSPHQGRGGVRSRSGVAPDQMSLRSKLGPCRPLPG